MSGSLYADKATMTEHYIDGLQSFYGFKSHRVVQETLASMAKFYNAPYSSWDRQLENWWQTDKKSKWVTRAFRHTSEAREFCKNFAPPAEIVHSARVLSREMVRELFQNGGTNRIERELSYGKFDANRMNRVMRDIKKGTFSPENTRPFKNRERLNPSRPHVGIVADGSWGTFWRDNEYVPRVMALMMGIAWACEAINCPATAAFTRRNDARRSSSFFGPDLTQLQYDLGATLVCAPSLKMKTSDLAIGFHPELYRMGTAFVCACHYDSVRVRTNMRDATDEYLRNNISPNVVGNECSSGGGYGVAYMKSMGASVTVAIGDIDDDNKATVKLAADTKLEDAIRKIAKTVGDQLRARRMEVAVK